MRGIKVIAFDADDTLWINETYFREAEERFSSLLIRFGDKEKICKRLFDIEMDNLNIYGYGAKAFTLSLLECAIKLSKENTHLPQLSTEETEEIIKIGTKPISIPITILDGVEKTLDCLSDKYILAIATKGDLLDQQAKLERSGLKRYFKHVEIMSNKKESDYLRMINLLGIEPNELLMVGNSLKSDILPVLNIGGHGVHIPFHTTWLHEEVEGEIIHPNFYVISQMDELLEIL